MIYGIDAWQPTASRSANHLARRVEGIRVDQRPYPPALPELGRRADR